MRWLPKRAWTPPKGSGFQGATLTHLVFTSKQVDAVLAQTKSACG
jgi:hypothetical protein